MKYTEEMLDYLSGRKFVSVYHMKLEPNEVVYRIDKTVEICKGKKIIHIGCCDHLPVIEEKRSQGTWLHEILENNCEKVLGLDINDEAVRYCNEKGYSKIPMICGDVTTDDFEFDFSEYDIVILGEIVEHVDNPTDFLRRMKENLAGHGFTGVFLITVPNAFRMLRIQGYMDGVEMVNSDHRYWFTP
ncbi:MAG: class I SAM-dependent methyltransferase [Lachnospiraceae bacterium]|nr:class I SAM-dependent methyltransferase [Lachnospiraceae bacterium]